MAAAARRSRGRAHGKGMLAKQRIPHLGYDIGEANGVQPVAIYTTTTMSKPLTYSPAPSTPYASIGPVALYTTATTSKLPAYSPAPSPSCHHQPAP